MTPGLWVLDGFPDLLAVHRRAPARYPCLLESAAPGPTHARYDILFAYPRERLWLRHDGAVLHDDREVRDASFLKALDRMWKAERTQPSAHALPFHGGWCLYLSYEVGAAIEASVPQADCPPTLPMAIAWRCPAALVRDHLTRRTYLVAEDGVSSECIEQMRADVAGAETVATSSLDVATIEEDEPHDFLAGVAKVQDYIRAGDVFQVNLSRRWRVRLQHAVAPADLYERLRSANPAPFAGLLAFEHGAIVSSSPERLILARDGRLSTRPIAGTWPRSEDPAEDAQAMQRLLAHPKERAEHVMLLDLERNDVGRVCRPGTVRVSESMHVETYRYVHHIVSEVSGVLRDGATPGDILQAVFPGGTITGCPKVRCMQIIHELERTARGAYTGSLGYLNRDGSLDLNILIRTLMLQDNDVELRAGSGIVADSDPQRELAETRAKARGLLAALGVRQ